MFLCLLGITTRQNMTGNSRDGLPVFCFFLLLALLVSALNVFMDLFLDILPPVQYACMLLTTST